MATILEQIKNLEKLSEKVIVDELFKALKDAEKLVLELNKKQLDDNENRDGVTFPNYAGITESYWRKVDMPRTEELFDYKVTSNKYNFDWSGEFLLGLNLTISGEEAVFGSTGMNGGKELLVVSRKAMGLNDENLKTIIKTKLLPYIHNFARRTLKI